MDAGRLVPRRNLRMGWVMKRNRAVAAVAGIAVAGVAVISGCGITHHDAVAPAPAASAVSSKVHQVSARPMARSASAIKTAKASGHASPHPSTTPPPPPPPTRHWRGWNRPAGRPRRRSMMISIPWPAIWRPKVSRRPSPITWPSRPTPASCGEKRSGSSLTRLFCRQLTWPGTSKC